MRTILLCTALVTGCTSNPTVPEVVKIPVVQPCLSAPPPEVPPLTDEAALLKMDDYAATMIAWTERLSLRAYSAKADALLQSCR